MAIGRSARAGHIRTMNVHRESKGENIGQNYRWLQGKPVNTAPAPPKTPTATPKKPAAPKPKPAPPKPTTPPPKKNTPAKQTTNNADVASGKAANAVNGKDLKGKFKFDDKSPDYAIEQVIKAQGFDGKPTVTSDLKAFSQACRASNFLAKRGVGATDLRTMKAYDDALKNGDFYVKCSGGSFHGYGMYTASVAVRGARSQRGVQDAELTARSYASGKVKKIYTMTLDKSAKIGIEDDLNRQMKQDKEFAKVCRNSNMRSVYTQDVGVYAAYKGYDAYIADDGRRYTDGSSDDYTVILNRSKLILYEAAS